MSDNDCQPTGEGFPMACYTLGITRAFTSYNNPKGNADTERLTRTMKEELISVQEWTSRYHLEHALAEWVERHNSEYDHSTLRYQSPRECERDYEASHLIQWTAA